MSFDTLPYHPTTRPASKYDYMTVLYDDGECACMGTVIVSGQTLNGVFPMPYFDPSRVYWMGLGQVHVMPERES